METFEACLNSIQRIIEVYMNPFVDKCQYVGEQAKRASVRYRSKAHTGNQERVAGEDRNAGNRLSTLQVQVN